jgi:glucokinase
LSPIFYITIGSGIGGGLIINGEIYRGCGRGAAEIGHLRSLYPQDESEGWVYEYGTLESVASGWGIEQRTRRLAAGLPHPADSALLRLAEGHAERITAWHVGQAALQGDGFAWGILVNPRIYLAEAICQVLALLCPRRIILGGGVSLMGEKLLFEPLRKLVAERVFRPFAGCYDIVPAALGEEVVVHGALALARRRLGAGV